MFHELVSRNDDLKRLVEKGYAITFDSDHLVVRDVPYLDKEKNLRSGAFVTKLDFVDKHQVRQVDHQVFFCGSHPHSTDGTPISNLAGGETKLTLKDLTHIVERSFSNKPVGSNGFPDFFEKIESYVRIISGPAMAVHPGASPLTFRVDTAVTSGSVFKFHDTLTSRAEIGDLTKKFSDDVITIIGLGGTGAYLLDFMIKTPVKEVRGFDRDAFHVHNAYRSPGRLLDEGELGKTKAEVYQQRYANFREGLRVEAKFIDASCESELEGVTFAFVCVDKGSARSAIFDLLLACTGSRSTRRLVSRSGRDEGFAAPAPRSAMAPEGRRRRGLSIARRAGMTMTRRRTAGARLAARPGAPGARVEGFRSRLLLRGGNGNGPAIADAEQATGGG